MTEFHFTSEEIDTQIWSRDAEVIALLEAQRKEKEFNLEVNAIRMALGTIEPIRQKKEGVKKDGRRPK